jgi:succinoglycan biosynthesis transport protein ExoP
LKNVRIGGFRMSTNAKTGFGGQGGVVSSSGGKSLNRSVARDSGSLGLPKIDALFLLGVARKHWKWIVPVALLLSGIGAALVLSFFKPVYEAKFRLEVDPSNYIVFADVRQSSPELIELQKAILFSNSVLEKVVSDKTVASVPMISQAKDPVNVLRTNVKVAASAGNRLLDVRFQYTDRKTAAAVVNTLVDEYLRSRRSIEQIRTSNQERNVLAALAKAESEVEGAKQRVRDLSLQAVKTDTVIGESESGRVDTSYLDDLRMKRMELNSQMSVLQLNLAELKAAYDRDVELEKSELASTNRTVEISDEMLDKDIVVMTSFALLEDARVKLKDLELNTSVGQKNPVFVNVKRRVDFLEKEYGRLRESRRKELSERGSTSNLVDRRKSIVELEGQIAGMRIEKDVMESQTKDYLTSLKQASATGVDLQFATADLEEWNDIRSTVHQRRVKLQTERDATDSVRELERAIPPRLPVEELPTKQILMASAAGFGIPFLLGFLMELRSRKVDDAHHLESRSRLSVLGEISTIPVAATGKLTKKRRSHARELRLFEESVDSLSTTLTLREDLRSCRVFTITSALSGEGKTSVSCQLVVSLARSTGSKVLLIDGDLRAPDVHHVFGRPMTAGLVGYLNGTDEWRDLVDRDWNDSIHLLTSGYLKGSPHRLLSNGRFEKLIEEARQEYDYIVLDTPPVLPASEALLFAKVADAVLMCALRDKSRIEQLVQAYQRLESSGCKVAGSVLSGVPVREYASYYGDYYASKV